MDLDVMFNDSIFDSIEMERLEAIKKISEEVKGKNATEVMMIILKYNKVLQTGRKITKNERDAMIEVIFNSLSDEEQNQFRSVIQVIENFTSP